MVDALITVESSMIKMVGILQEMKVQRMPQQFMAEINAMQSYIERIAQLSKIVATLPAVERGQEFSREVQARIYPLISEIMKEPAGIPPNLKTAMDHVILSANAALKTPERAPLFAESVTFFSEQCATSIAANISDIYKIMHKKYKSGEVTKEEFKTFRRNISSSLSATKRLGIKWGKPGKKLYLESILGTVLTMKAVLAISILWAALNTLIWGGAITMTLGFFGAMAPLLYFLGSTAYQFTRLTLVVRGGMEALGRYMAG